MNLDWSDFMAITRFSLKVRVVCKIQIWKSVEKIWGRTIPFPLSLPSGGVGAESYDRKKAWSSIIHSKLTGMGHYSEFWYRNNHYLRRSDYNYCRLYDYGCDHEERFATFCTFLQNKEPRVAWKLCLKKWVNFNEIWTVRLRISISQKLAINEAI